MRQILAIAIAGYALAAATPATAQDVYKWKDAKGVTHYSERPPAKGAYSTQDAVRDPTAPATQASAASGNAQADSRCTTARNTLSALLGKNPPQADTDNDGKPDRPLSEAERASQVELNRSTLKAYNCSEGAPSA